jgi:hypothetical protein
MQHYLRQGGKGGAEAPSGSRVKPRWGTRVRSPEKLLNFRDFISFKIFSTKYFSIFLSLKTGGKLIKSRKIYNFLD